MLLEALAWPPPELQALRQEPSPDRSAVSQHVLGHAAFLSRARNGIQFGLADALFGDAANQGAVEPTPTCARGLSAGAAGPDAVRRGRCGRCGRLRERSRHRL